MSENVSENNTVDMSDLSEKEEYINKHSKLLRKCEALKLDNERLINNICQIKKIIYKYKQQRRLLMKRLDKYKDDYRNSSCPLFAEKDEMNFQESNSRSKTINSLVRSYSIMKNKKSKSEFKNDCKISATSPQNVPKKPINPYLIFCQDKRTSMQEKYQLENNSEMSHQDLTKALAQNWHELTVTEKQIYYNLYDQQKERYESEMKAFTASKMMENDLEAT